MCLVKTNRKVSHMKVYPIFLNRLSEKKVVLIGGNHEAGRKAGELLECDANVTIISPSLTGGLTRLVDENALTWINRSYQKGDLDGAFLVIVAEYRDDENHRIYEEAEQRGILVNVMDDIPHCNFTFGSLIKRGPLTISVSTSGAAPALAVRLRERFEKDFGEEYEQFLRFSRSLRKPMARAYPSFQERKQLWYKLVDSDILALIRSNEHELAYEKAAEIVGPEVVREALDMDS